MRVAREHMFMMIARGVSLRATCPRLNVGAVIVVDNNIVSMGYNGSKKGEPHCIDVGCMMDGGGCKRTIHAEENAYRRLSKYYLDSPKTLYVTHSPCIECARIIAKKGTKKVIFEVPYRNQLPVEWLKGEGVKVFQCSPSGHVTQL